MMNADVEVQLPSCYTYKCFPVRDIFGRKAATEGGAWLTEYRASLQQQAIKCKLVTSSNSKRWHEHVHGHCKYVNLDKFILLKVSHCSDPSEVCIVDISGKSLSWQPGSDSEGLADFWEFCNVAHMNASDNRLQLEAFRSFSGLRVLDLQLNQITGLAVECGDFPNLEVLDMSFNSISCRDILRLGVIPNLKKLVLAGCGLTELPPEMAGGIKSPQASESSSARGKKIIRFSNLEVLDLSSNELTDFSSFASMAGMKSLRRLILSHNCITCVPRLRLVAAQRPPSGPTLNAVDTVTEADRALAPNVSDTSCLSRRTSVKRDVSTVERSADFFLKFAMDSETDRLGEHAIETSLHLLARELDGLGISCLGEVSDADMVKVDALREDVVTIASDAVHGQPLTSETSCAPEIEASASAAQTLVAPSKFIAGSSHSAPESRHDEYQSDTRGSGSSDRECQQPFPFLVALDLSYNKIEKESGLFALSMWPSLVELNITGNPLVRARKATSLYLKHHLETIRGIRIRTRESSHPPRRRKTHTAVTRPRRVNDKLPPIKARDIDLELSMLSLEGKPSGGFLKSPSTTPDGSGERKKARASPSTCLAEESVEGPSYHDEPVFLTQLGEFAELNSKEGFDCSRELREEDLDLAPSSQSPWDKVDGDDDDDNSGSLPPTMQGKLHELRRLLNDRHVFTQPGLNVATNLQTLQRCKPTANTQSHPPPAFETKMQLLTSALDHIRQNPNTISMQLDKALTLSDSDPFKKEFRDASKLLARVEKKYRRACEQSLLPELTARHQAEVERSAVKSRNATRAALLNRFKIDTLTSLSPCATPSSRKRRGTPSSRLSIRPTSSQS